MENDHVHVNFLCTDMSVKNSSGHLLFTSKPGPYKDFAEGWGRKRGGVEGGLIEGGPKEGDPRGTPEVQKLLSLDLKQSATGVNFFFQKLI